MFDHVNNSIKGQRRVLRHTDQGSSCTVVNDENDAESNEGVSSQRSSSPLPSLQPRRRRLEPSVVQRVTGPKKPSKQRRARKKWARSVQRNGRPINDGFSGC